LNVALDTWRRAGHRTSRWTLNVAPDTQRRAGQPASFLTLYVASGSLRRFWFSHLTLTKPAGPPSPPIHSSNLANSDTLRIPALEFDISRASSAKNGTAPASSRPSRPPLLLNGIFRCFCRSFVQWYPCNLAQSRETAAEAQACCIRRMKQGESALLVSDTANVPAGIDA
jgi:hypothetical protein